MTAAAAVLRWRSHSTQERRAPVPVAEQRALRYELKSQSLVFHVTASESTPQLQKAWDGWSLGGSTVVLVSR
jgi:hypothetical protein